MNKTVDVFAYTGSHAQTQILDDASMNKQQLASATAAPNYTVRDEDGKVVQKSEIKHIFAKPNDIDLPTNMVVHVMKNTDGETVSAEVTGDIPPCAFYGCDKMKSIKFTNVTKIGPYAFYGCENLEITELPDTITEIGEYAFYCCKKVEITKLPDALSGVLGKFAFCGTKITGDIVIPAEVTGLGFGVFSGSSALTAVRFAENSKCSFIDGQVVNGTSVETFVVPASVVRMEYIGHPNTLKNFEFEDRPENGNELDIDLTIMSGFPELTHLDFPNNIKPRPDDTYKPVITVGGCLKLERLTFKSLSQSAADLFIINGAGAINLKTIIAPKNLKVLTGGWSFGGLNNIQEFKFAPDGETSSLQRICGPVFSANGSPSEFVLPASLKVIDSSAFSGANGVKTITFSGTPEYIGESAFGSALTTINCPWSSGAVPGAPWGATNATIVYDYSPS